MAWEMRYCHPEVYFSEEAALNYEKSPRMRKVQEAMALFCAQVLREKGVAKGRVLDAGCGTGFSALVLKEEGYNVVGVDVSEPMLKIAESKGLEVKKADIKSLPFEDNSFDAITCLSVLQWITGNSPEQVTENFRKTASEFRRVLKKGGIAVVQFYPKVKEEEGLVLDQFRKEKFGLEYTFFLPGTREEKKFWVFTCRKKEKGPQ